MPGPAMDRRTFLGRGAVAVGAVALRARAVPAAPRAVVAAALEALQVAQRVIAHDDHVSPAPAVAAIGAAARHVGFAAKAHAAVAAGACLDVDPRAIVKHADHRDSSDTCGRTRIGYG